MQLRSPNHEACRTLTTNGTGQFNPRHVLFSKQGCHTRPREWSRLPAAQVSRSPSSLDPPSVTSTMESSAEEAGAASTADVLRASDIKEVKPEELFAAEHVEAWSPQLLAYFPLGCALAVVRFAAWIAGIALDAPWFRQMSVINAYMALLGVKVTWRDTHNIPEQRHVLVSNHVSVGDLLMLFQQPQRYVHLITSALPQQVYATRNLPAILQPANKGTYLAIAAQQQQAEQVLPSRQHQLPDDHSSASGFAGLVGSSHSSSSSSRSSHDFSSSSSSSHADMSGHHYAQQQQQQQDAPAADSVAAAAAAAAASCKAAVDSVAGSSVHVFPEGGMTDGSGMMRFSRGFMLFADKLPVVPVALRVKTAFPEVNCHTLTSPFLANLFWFSFQPWTEIEAVALPPMQLAPGESKAAFVQRVQLAIAQELGVWVADMNIQQKRSLVQQRQRQAKQQARR